MRCNVDLLKIIQVGITLADEEGHSPPDCSTWQFNFKFSTEYVISLLIYPCNLLRDDIQRRYVHARFGGLAHQVGDRLAAA